MRYQACCCCCCLYGFVNLDLTRWVDVCGVSDVTRMDSDRLGVAYRLVSHVCYRLVSDGNRLWPVRLQDEAS